MACVPCIAFVVGGGGLFWLGLRVWKSYRRVAGTPLSPVGGMQRGLVRLRGRATGDDRLRSPLTGAPCFYYDVDVWRYSEDRTRDVVAGEENARPFYLHDGTAKVRVDPKGAQWRVWQTFRASMSSNAVRDRFVEPSLEVPGPSDEELRAYVPNYFTRLRAQVGAVGAPAGIRDAAEKVLAAAQWLESKDASMSVSGGNFTMGVGHVYHFSERCLLADRECTVFGTCVENPAPKDDRDRNLVQVGQEAGTFLIDSSGEGPGKDLRRNALLLLLIGAAAMMIGVYFLFH